MSPKMSSNMSSTAGRRPHFNAQDEIKRLILDRGLQAGAAIQTEAELMDELGISRGSLREALKGLEAHGIIEVQHGRGMFVAQPSLGSLVDGLTFRGRLASSEDQLTTASELIDVRDILESALVRQVAATADAELLDQLEQMVAEMECSAVQGRPFQDTDRQFHEQLYSQLGNSLVIELVRAFWDVLEAVRPQLVSVNSDAETDARHHRLILDRIRAGDQDGAQQAMADHFRVTHLWIQGEQKA